MPITLNGSGTITGVSSLATALVNPVVTTTMGVGNATPAASGAGITFPAAVSASSDANTLDDYEEGTFNPTATASTGSITSYTSSGTYTKIGRQVTFCFTVTITNAGTGTGTLQVSLPFAVSSVASVGAGTEDANTGVMLQIQAAASGSTGFVKTYLGATPIATNNVLRLTVTYFV